MCPIPNLRTGVVPFIQEHPIRRFYGQELFVTVNTDGPKMFNTSLEDEFSSLMNEAGFTPSDVVALTQNAIEAAWCSREMKAGLRAELDAYRIS